MNTKQIVLLAVMLALPITANAEYTYNNVDTPARVPNNGTVTEAGIGPYQTITPGADDDKHIASTKYVIGAYNDVIAAVNGLVVNKQHILANISTGQLMSNTVVGDGDILEFLTEEADLDGETVLPSVTGMVVSIKSQRVEVYTNWDDDSAKTEVPFVTATGD